MIAVFVASVASVAVLALGRALWLRRRCWREHLLEGRDAGVVALQRAASTGRPWLARECPRCGRYSLERGR